MWQRSMAFEVILSPDAERDLKSLDSSVARRVLKKLLWFAAQSNPLRFAVQLRHAAVGDIRFRVGDFRVIAVLDRSRKRMVINAIGHRREVYRS